MKALYSIAIALIAALTLAAFNPESVGRMAREAKDKLVDQPRVRANYRALAFKAESGDADAQYRVGMSLVSNHYERFPPMKRAFADFSPDDGERMVRDAAAQGHADARYWVWKTDGGTEAEFLEIHKAGSIATRIHVYRSFLNDICDTSWDPYVEIIQEQNHDPGSYIYSQANFDDDRVREIATAFDEGVARIREARRTSCQS